MLMRPRIASFAYVLICVPTLKEYTANMSMLAEKKRKQKWSLNPRGNDWVQDSNKFGQKMLEKMGWQHGKGLGAKEDGITEHVKVSYKNDSKGMGYKESNDQWTEHETNFSALLESLSGEKPNEIKLNSLEKKSQSSRARVHYHKFTRGKDLSRYSEKDLANIFGKKSLKEKAKVEVNAEKVETSAEKEESESKFLFNAGSMRDYFKRKLPSFGKSNSYVIGENGVLKKEESESEDTYRPSFGFNSDTKREEDDEVSYVGFGFKSAVTVNDEPKNLSVKPTFVSYVNGSRDEENTEKKSKKKRKADAENAFSPKKKLRKDVSNIDGIKGVSNPAFDPLHTPVRVQKHILDTIEESVSENEENSSNCIVTNAEIHASPKKTKKCLSENTLNNVEPEESEETIRERKKKHRKAKVCEENANVATVVVIDAENDAETSYEVKRKKKKRKSSGNEENSVDVELKKSKKDENDVVVIDDSKEGETVYENPNFEENLEEIPPVLPVEENPYEVKAKKPKKKKKEREINGFSSIDLTTEDCVTKDLAGKSKVKKNKNKNLAVENPGFDNVSVEETIDLSQIEDNPYEVKVKKSKKKSKENFESSNSNDLIEDSTSFSQTEENPYEVKVKQKKSKKKKKIEEYGVENPNFNKSLEETTIDLEENPYEVKPKKKKKKNEEYGMENPNFDESLEESTIDIEENPYEVKLKKKKKKKNEEYGMENPNFNESLETTTTEVEENPYEVKLKKKKKKKNEEYAMENPNFNPHDSPKEHSNKFEADNVPSTPVSKEDPSVNIEESDLMLNIATTPIIKKTEKVNGENSYSITKINRVKRRKSVRFSDVTQERIIPSNEDLRDIENRNELFEINTRVINNSLEEQSINFDMSSLDKFSYNGGKIKKLGVDNAAFDKQKTNLEENLDSISKTIDRYQAEVENDINEKKLETLTVEDIMIGEVGNPHGEHEKLPEGTKLKFKYANFMSRTPFYHLDKTGAKKSYKHLIKGDIVVGFKNTNLHEIQGYAVRAQSTSV